ncbi:amidohydrolase [bacterium]|nr:amidohydrolase [bacterium]
MFSSPHAQRPVTVYKARHIHTMDANRPVATHLAVREGMVLAVGTLEDVSGWGPMDERLAQQMLLPGLVEGHSHLMAGAMWQFVYCGAYDACDPEGRTVPGLGSLKTVLDALRQHARTSDTDGPIAGWALDPLLLRLPGITRADLDGISDVRPVAVLHGNGHIVYANSVALRQANLLRPGIQTPGIPLGEDGLPRGELKGPEAMMSVLESVGMLRAFRGAGESQGLAAFGRRAVRAGVTTATDLGVTLTEAKLATLLQAMADERYPVRLVPALRSMGMHPSDAVARARELQSLSTERLRLGKIKIVLDGSIQGFSARLRWPGYYNGASNGLWYVPPETVRETFELALQHSLQVHIHTNGDEAVDVVLDALESALLKHNRPDHRFTLQHCQLADAAQFRRMRTLGMGANLLVDHFYYWGEAHRASTIGPDRAERMNACRTALDSGVDFSIHSDAPITPMAPLFTAWCAVNRLTHAGRVLGEHQRVSVADALHAITLGAARTLKLDDEIGSIEVGKKADLRVLEQDPFEVAPQNLKDVPVWGTMVGGRLFPALNSHAASGA